MGRKKKNKDDNLDNLSDARELQEYYDIHTLSVPSGCRACGGPYPSCCDSCSMFDD